MLRTYPLKPHIAYRKWGFSRARTNHVTDAPKGATSVTYSMIVATPSSSVGTYCPLDRMYTPAALVGQQGYMEFSVKRKRRGKYPLAGSRVLSVPPCYL